MSHGPYRIRDAVTGDLPAILAINAESVPGVSALTPPESAVLLEEATCLRVADEGRDVIAYVIVFASDPRRCASTVAAGSSKQGASRPGTGGWPR